MRARWQAPRSNPSRHEGRMDCFVAVAPRNDGLVGDRTLSHHALARATHSNRFGVWLTTAPSIASILSLVVTPPLAENPPGLPPAASTRWQGTTIGQGLRPSAWPTSRDSSTPPSRLAMSP